MHRNNAIAPNIIRNLIVLRILAFIQDAGADTGFQKRVGVWVTVNYKNVWHLHTCAPRFFPLYEVCGTPPHLEPPLGWWFVQW